MVTLHEDLCTAMYS